jgi:hypothetical protein
MRLYWGDLHAHCAVSYGHGTPARAVANARQHLDFCSLTGHAFWPDMPLDVEQHDDTMMKHFGGFEKLRRFWPALLDTLEGANRPGSFVTFPSYEWHSMAHGDHNCYARGPDLPLLDADTPAGLETALRHAGCDPLVLPHHIGYATGYRGVDWTSFDPSRSPLLEIFSNHGCSEADDAPYPYHHTMGPRFGASTARDGLVAGHRFGFQAGTDSHDGYPGHYGHGRVGVFADALDRPHLWEALRARRTIASTGANIRIEVELDGAGPGEVVSRRDRMDLSVRVEGTDAVTRLTLVEGGAHGWVTRPLATSGTASAFAAGRHKLRVETGWGRHGTRSSWHVQALIREGELVAATPYFRYAGHGNDEAEPSERVVSRGDASVAWVGRALAHAAGGVGGSHHSAGGPQTMHLEVRAEDRTSLLVEANGVAVSVALPDLARRSVGRHLGGLSSPAVVVTRAVPESAFTARHQGSLAPSARGAGFVYLRVEQADGQAAWASPIFYE